MDYRKLSKKQLIEELKKLKEKQDDFSNSNFLTSECYHQIFNSTNDALIVHELNNDGTPGLFIQANITALKLLGFTQSEILEKTIYDILPRGFQDKASAINKEIFTTKEINYEIVIITKNGNNIPVEVNARLFNVKNKNLVISILKDLVEKRRAKLRQQKNTENSKLLLKLFLNAPELNDQELFDYILNTAVQLTNSTIGFLHKVSEDQKTIILTAWNVEALKNCTASYNTHSDLDKAGNWVDCIHTGEPVIYNDFPNSPNRKGLPEGHTPIQRFMSIPVYEQGKIRYIFGVGNKINNYKEHDIIQIQLVANEFAKLIKKRSADRALKESEEKFRNIFENSVVGFYRTTPKGEIILANPTLIKMLGYSSFDELSKLKLRKSQFDSLHPRSDFLDLIKQNGKVVDLESVWYKKDGSKLFVSESASVFYDEKRKIKYYEGTVTDITKRKLTEKAFYESEQRYKALFDAASDAIFIMKEGKFIDCNQKTLEMFGCTKEQIINKQPGQFSPTKQPDGQNSKDKVSEKINLAFKGNPQVFEWKHKKIDGGPFDAEVSLKKIDLSSDTYLQAIVRDITERKTTEKALLVSETKLKEAQQIAHIGHWNLDLTSNKLDWSDEIFRIFNIDQNKFEATYEAFLHTIHPDDREIVNKAYTESLKNKTKYNITHRIVLPSGELRYVREQCVTKYSKSEEPLYSLGTIQDITELKIAEEELNNYKEHLEELVTKRTTEVNRLSQAVEQSPVSVVITNLDGDIIYVNKTFTKVTGYNKRESIGQNPRILKSDYHSKSFYKEIWDTILSGKTWRGEFKNKKKNGEEYWEIASISPIMNKRKEILSFVAVKEDITNKKKLEDALIIAKETAEKATHVKSVFLANMSHEIRTPMNAIIGFTELLLSSVEDEKHIDYLKALHSSSNNLLSLINDILDFSKVEAGKMELSYEDVNTSSFFSEINDIFILKIQDKGLKFIIEISDELPQVIKIDDLRLRQVLINLINNAIKFTEKGFIKLKVDYTNKESKKTYQTGDLSISIQDTGIGISKEYQRKIFESFTQESVKTTKKFGGSGLGLAISLKLIQLMKGSINVNSKPNKGSTFTIHLPRIKTSNKIVKTSLNSKNEFRKVYFDPATIVVVDDVENNRNYLIEVLRKQGFIVHSAENGELALLLAKRVNPDLIITDLRMPIMDGYEFFKEYRKLNKKVPIIATSASVVINKQLRLKNSKFNDFLTKPILFKELIEILIKYIPYKKEITKEKIVGLSKKAIKNLPIVLQALENDFYDDWKKLEKRKPVEKLQKFGERLRLLGTENNNSILIQYADSLIKAVNSFDVDSILSSFQNYKNLISTLQNYYERHKE